MSDRVIWSMLFVACLVFNPTLKQLAADQVADTSSAHFVIVVGAVGADEYEEPFREWAERWQSAAESMQVSCETIGLESESEVSDLAQLRSSIEKHQTSEKDLWLVFIGHGTFNTNIAKFNLRGPDLAASELQEKLKSVVGRVIVVQCASSSGPFLNAISGKNRIVVTATKSGSESNYARFGDYLSAAISDPSADLDHDRQVSLLEAFLLASGRTHQFYIAENRLATEHALLDDNGDSRGTSASFYRGIRAIKRGKDDAEIDGRVAGRLILFSLADQPVLSPEQLAKRTELESQFDALREKKATLEADAYYSELEQIAVGLAEVYEEE